VKMEWVGASTQLRVYQPNCFCNQVDTEYMKFHILKLVEHDPVSNKKVQFIPTITNYHPDLVGPINEQKYGVDATKAMINGTIGDFNMQAMFTMWFFHLPDMPNLYEYKNFTIGNNVYKIYDNTMKYDVYFKGWPFVDYNNVLQFTVRIETPGSNTNKTTLMDNGWLFEVPVLPNQDYSRIIYPNIVNVDNTFKTFTITLDPHGDNTDVYLEFPSFKNFLDYDPIIDVPPRPCGNNKLDSGEQCDYGFEGCSANCTCVAPYVPAGTVDCVIPNPQVNNNGLASSSSGAVAAGVVVIICIVLVGIFVGLFILHKKNILQKVPEKVKEVFKNTFAKKE